MTQIKSLNVSASNVVNEQLTRQRSGMVMAFKRDRSTKRSRFQLNYPIKYVMEVDWVREMNQQYMSCQS